MAAAAQKDAEGTASDKEQRFLASVQKQDRLLYLCAYLLLNLSEDAEIERKMQKRVSICTQSFLRAILIIVGCIPV